MCQTTFVGDAFLLDIALRASLRFTVLSASAAVFSEEYFEVYISTLLLVSLLSHEYFRNRT